MEETFRITRAALVHEKLISKPASPRPDVRALLDDVVVVVKGWPDKDQKQRLSFVLVAAEGVRVERNGAAHPSKVVDDGAAIEELIGSAARQIPVFWEIPIQQAAAAHQGVVPGGGP